MGTPDALRAVHGLRAPEALAQERRESLATERSAADAADQLQMGLMAKRMQFLYRLSRARVVGYFGQRVNGKAHGRGRMRWADGAFYTGDFHLGLPQGHGTGVSADGSERYVGEWRGGRRHGACVSPRLAGRRELGPLRWA